MGRNIIDFVDTKKGREKYFREHLIHFLTDYFDISEISPNHFRIESRVNTRIVDYYPKSEASFLLDEKKWGRIKITELEEKLKKYLKV